MMKIELQLSPTLPLGRRLWIVDEDGTRADAETSPAYAAHRRDMESLSLDDRIAHYEGVRNWRRFTEPELIAIELDVRLRPGHVLEIEEEATRLLRCRPATSESRRGRELEGLLTHLRQRFRAEGRRGFGRSSGGGTVEPHRKRARHLPIDEAKQFLLAFLANGPRPACEVWAASPVSKPTLRRAANELGVDRGPGGPRSPWSLRRVAA